MDAPSNRLSRYGWRWTLLLAAGMGWLSVGCSPATLSMFLMPFTDNNIPPEYKLFEKDQEYTLVILSNFARPTIDPAIQGADADLANALAAAFRKRCSDNKHKIKIVSDAEARSRNLNDGMPLPVEVGKHFKADYVLDLTIQKFTLYEPNFHPQMFRGRADIGIALYKMDVKEGGHKVYSKDFHAEYPRSRPPIEVNGAQPGPFRNLFVPVIARDISKMFIAYAPEEKREID